MKSKVFLKKIEFTDDASKWNDVFSGADLVIGWKVEYSDHDDLPAKTGSLLREDIKLKRGITSVDLEVLRHVDCSPLGTMTLSALGAESEKQSTRETGLLMEKMLKDFDISTGDLTAKTAFEKAGDQWIGSMVRNIDLDTVAQDNVDSYQNDVSIYVDEDKSIDVRFLIEAKKLVNDGQCRKSITSGNMVYSSTEYKIIDEKGDFGFTYDFSFKYPSPTSMQVIIETSNDDASHVELFAKYDEAVVDDRLLEISDKKIIYIIHCDKPSQTITVFPVKFSSNLFGDYTIKNPPTAILKCPPNIQNTVTDEGRIFTGSDYVLDENGFEAINFDFSYRYPSTSTMKTIVTLTANEPQAYPAFVTLQEHYNPGTIKQSKHKFSSNSAAGMYSCESNSQVIIVTPISFSTQTGSEFKIKDSFSAVLKCPAQIDSRTVSGASQGDFDTFHAFTLKPASLNYDADASYLTPISMKYTITVYPGDPAIKPVEVELMEYSNPGGERYPKLDFVSNQVTKTYHCESPSQTISVFPTMFRDTLNNYYASSFGMATLNCPPDLSLAVSDDTDSDGIPDSADNAIDSAGQNHFVPSWIKNNAQWWTEDKISDIEFVKGIEHLIENKLITSPKFKVIDSTITQTQNTMTLNVPPWIKNNVGWWASGQTNDNDFLSAIEYLIREKILRSPNIVIDEDDPQSKISQQNFKGITIREKSYELGSSFDAATSNSKMIPIYFEWILDFHDKPLSNGKLIVEIYEGERFIVSKKDHTNQKGFATTKFVGIEGHSYTAKIVKVFDKTNVEFPVGHPHTLFPSFSEITVNLPVDESCPYEDSSHCDRIEYDYEDDCPYEDSSHCDR